MFESPYSDQNKSRGSRAAGFFMRQGGPLMLALPIMFGLGSTVLLLGGLPGVISAVRFLAILG